MSSTPFISPLKSQGGSFYTFSSSAEDLGLTFNSDTKKFRFSKFALLSIPNVATPAFEDNKVQFEAIDGALLQGGSGDANTDLSNSFQNYCLNAESMFISRSGYDRNLKHNVTERIFFKWLKELGALRFQAANSAESTTNSTTDPRFREEQETLTGAERYYQVVQYIGAIDVVNNVQNNVNAYSELYIHVPTKDGRTPLVLFKSENDINYKADMEVRHLPADPLDTETIYGRHYNDVHPAGLDILAIFDQDVIGSPSNMMYNTGTAAFDIAANWYDPSSGPNAYFTEPTTFTSPANDWIEKTYGLSVITYHRSKLDGIGIDFDPLSYKPVVDNASITTIEEFNSTVDAGPFEFNCVLVYYDVYDPNDLTDSATNLYGVLFLEDVEQISTEYGIPRFKKFVPDAVTKLNGNSYAFKINLKFDTSVENVGTEKAINDFSSFSMDLFIDVFNVMQTSSDVLTAKTDEIIAMNDKILALEDLIINTDQLNEIDLRIGAIEDTLQTSQSLFDNSTAVMDLIQKNIDAIDGLVAGETSIEITYNLDILKGGAGITVDKTVPNKVTLINTNQEYNIGALYKADISGGATLVLLPFTNYFKHYTGGLNLTATADITINIDDTVNKWQKGQTFRLVIEDVLDIAAHNLIIMTDAGNVLGAGAYGVLVANLAGAEFDLSLDTPIFDIVCVDPLLLIFEVDRIR